MSLKAFNSIISDNKPKFQSYESFAQRNLPVHVINRQTRIFMLKVQRVHIECIVQTSAILHPHSSAVKMDHKPFRRVKSNTVSVFDTLHKSSQFWTHESRTCIGGI